MGSHKKIQLHSCPVIGCGSPHLLPSVIGEKFHDDNQAIHQSDIWGKPARTSSTILNKYGESGQPCLVPDFSGIALSFSPFNLIFIYMVYYIDRLSYVAQSLHLWDKAYLVMVDNVFDVFLESVCQYFIEYFCIDLSIRLFLGTYSSWMTVFLLVVELSDVLLSHQCEISPTSLCEHFDLADLSIGWNFPSSVFCRAGFVDKYCLNLVLSWNILFTPSMFQKTTNNKKQFLRPPASENSIQKVLKTETQGIDAMQVADALSTQSTCAWMPHTSVDCAAIDTGTDAATSDVAAAAAADTDTDAVLQYGETKN
ncbi:hypothetical protein STEG23_035079 [Scotinomys teguina]